MNLKTSKLKQHKNNLENSVLLLYANEENQNREVFNKTKENLITNAENKKISIIKHLSNFLKRKVSTLLGKSVSMFLLFLIQFIIMYYPFAIIADYLFKSDFGGLGGYIVIFILDMIFIGLLNKYCKIPDYERINYINDLKFESSDLHLSFEEFKKETCLDQKTVNYIKNKMSVEFKNELYNKFNIKNEDISSLSYEDLFMYIDSTILGVN